MLEKKGLVPLGFAQFHKSLLCACKTACHVQNFPPSSRCVLSRALNEVQTVVMGHNAVTFGSGFSAGATHSHLGCGDRDRMASQLLAESLGRDPRFEIFAVAAAADIFPIATRGPDVSLISMEFDAGAKKGLQVARALSAVHPGFHIVILLEESTGNRSLPLFAAVQPVCSAEPSRSRNSTIAFSTSTEGRFGLGATRLSTCWRRCVTLRPATASRW